MKEQESKAENWILVLEGVLLFIGIPLLTYWELIPIPKIILLIIVASYCGYQLWKKSELAHGILTRVCSEDASKNILVRTPIVMAALFSLVWIFHPDQLFAFPAERPALWLLVMSLYPFISALPQEFIFRTFYFYHYRKLISSEKLLILTSAVLFAFMHIVYHNWWAIGISFIGGLLFGTTYVRTRSLFWVSVEHTIYGWLVFTLGLESYFYDYPII